jgi:hypothetical protein
MKTLLALLALVAASLAADPPRIVTEDVARNKFSLINKPLALGGWVASSREISATHTRIEFGSYLVATVPTAALPRIRLTPGRALYAYIQSVDRLDINLVLLGNHVGYDINRKPVYSWQQTGDKW